MADTSQDREHPSGWTVDTLKEYLKGELVGLKAVIDERDRFYLGEIEGLTKLNANSFANSDKAIGKAEQAQKEYNERSNEFRGQLDDQAKTLMPRLETMQILKGLEDKVASNQLNGKSELEALRASVAKITDGLGAEIKGLRESRSAVGGKESALQTFVEDRRSSLTLVVSVVFGILAFAVAVAAYFKR